MPTHPTDKKKGGRGGGEGGGGLGYASLCFSGRKRVSGLWRGPEQLSVPGLHGRKSERAAPPHQAHQHRLGLIVEGVAQDDGARVLLAGDAPQEGIAYEPGRFLESPVLKSLGRGVGAARPQGELHPVAKLLAELGIRPGILPQGVVEVGRHHANARLSRRAQQGVGQGHGIGPAGECHPHRNAGPQEPHGVKAPSHG